MKNNRTKRSLTLSLLSLLLCISMFVGTTFAWFTDSVSSASNIITAGNLDVDVYYGDPADEKSIQAVDTLFKDVALWEPGAVAYENLTVTNKGSLALKYQMSVSFGNENYVMEDGEALYGLSDILKIAVVEGGVDASLTRDQLIASIPAADWAAIGDFTLDGELLGKTAEEPVGLVIWWNPSDEDNNFNVNNGKVTSDLKEYLHIELGINLVATQYTYEEDSFDKNYDLMAAYPVVPSKWLPEGVTLNEGAVTVIVPKGAPMGEYDIDVTGFSKSVDKDGKAKIDMDITVTKDGTPVEPGSAVYTVIIAGDRMSEDHEVTHNGQPVEKYKYDPFYNGIMFTTTSFSPFSVEYAIFGEDVVVDAEAGTIQSGLFKELDAETPDRYNPVKIDPTLDSNSESVVIKYEADGVVNYVVSPRASTVIVGDADDGGATVDSVEFLNGSVPAENVKPITNSKLYAVISGLQSNEHSTVCILPGTYKEATTVGVYSSMDIIGLGAAKDVKVIKQAASSSNRHLFNCSGTKADYIEVTLRNLHLDATAKTTNNKDNAAVQSIRKSKVKCYDLEIVKGTGWDAVAFYVNGNNAVDGVKYPAYLYAEHCSLNTTRTFGIVTTSGSYKFYHTGLTYNNGTLYTTNSGSIKNVLMPSEDWDW